MINTILIFLAASLIAVGVAQRFSLSPIVGFILAGILVGPHGLAVVPDFLGIRQLAEFGIVFLMFTIGLEFSLSRLLADRPMVLVLGGLQVLLSVSVFASLAWAMQMPMAGAITIGAALAMSSTAIVSRLLLERNEIDSIYGRTVIGILLFQDLATIVFLLVLPVITHGSMALLAEGLVQALAKGTAVFFILLFTGRLLVRPLFGRIAVLHSPELFTLGVLLVSVSAAAFAHGMGLSLALGGFMAGTVVGETEFRHQVEADIRPFQDVLLGLFFITVGMLVDLGTFGRLWPAIVLLTAGLLLIKAMLVFLLSWAVGVPAATSMRTGIALAHGGEFSLVILFLALRMNMLPAGADQAILAAVLLSMVVAPILIRYSATLAERLSGVPLRRAQQAIGANVETAAGDLSDHVIVCGYGRVGRNIAWYLAEENVAHLALDLDLNRLRQPAGVGERVTYGDATRRHILVAAGLERAQAVVIAYDDVRAVLKTLGHVHALRPDVTTIVRAADEQHLDELLDAGATEVIPETLETSLTMAAHVLTLLGVPVARVAERSDRIRADRYRLLRGMFHGRSSRHRRDLLRIIPVPPGAFAVGRSLAELRLDERQVAVTAIRRHGIRGAEPDPAMRLQAHDALIVHGSPDALAWAERRLLKGDETALGP
ncbi:MAG: cation:proton antiporter domain-containing protein [Thiobacillus sp.]